MENGTETSHESRRRLRLSYGRLMWPASPARVAMWRAELRHRMRAPKDGSVRAPLGDTTFCAASRPEPGGETTLRRASALPSRRAAPGVAARRASGLHLGEWISQSSRQVKGCACHGAYFKRMMRCQQTGSGLASRLQECLLQKSLAHRRARACRIGTFALRMCRGDSLMLAPSRPRDNRLAFTLRRDRASFRVLFHVIT